MALQSSDLFYVQRGVTGFNMPASQLQDFILGSDVITYRGTVDCTAPVGAQLNPNPPVVGDVYINTGDGTVDGTGTGVTNQWVGIGGETIQNGQRVLFDGTSWAIVGLPADGDLGGVASVGVTAPITKTGAEDTPTIGISEATNAAYGSTRLAQDPPNGGDLTSTATTDVLTVPHFNELAGRITTAAGGGIQSVTGSNGITASETNGDVTVSGIDASTADKGVTQLTSSISASEALAVTPKGVGDYAVPLDLTSLNELN